jgi:Protein of unknown function (DUF4242)
MRYFVDTHDQANGTFPQGLGPEQLREFSAGFAQACQDEGVVILRLHVNLEAGRAFCFTMAEDAGAVRRAHERVGLPFDDITEVSTVTPADLFLAAAAAPTPAA